MLFLVILRNSGASRKRRPCCASPWRDVEASEPFDGFRVQRLWVVLSAVLYHTILYIHIHIYDVLYTFFCILYAIYSTYSSLYTIYFILYTLYYFLFPIYHILYTKHYILYPLYSMLYTLYYILYTGSRGEPGPCVLVFYVSTRNETTRLDVFMAADRDKQSIYVVFIEYFRHLCFIVM